jgi:hypothetical protein
VSNPIVSRCTSGICRSMPWKDTGTLFGLPNVSWLSWFFDNESPYGLINLPTTYALDCLQGINTYICISIWYVVNLVVLLISRYGFFVANYGGFMKVPENCDPALVQIGCKTWLVCSCFLAYQIPFFPYNWRFLSIPCWAVTLVWSCTCCLFNWQVVCLHIFVFWFVLICDTVLRSSLRSNVIVWSRCLRWVRKVLWGMLRGRWGWWHTQLVGEHLCHFLSFHNVPWTSLQAMR